MCKRSKCVCCEVESVFGYSLKKGVLLVGIVSLVMSIMMLFMAVTCIIAVGTSKKQYNSNPVMASTLIFGLVTCSLSIYQIILSMLLIWQSIRTKGSIFICVLWYVSHISLLTMYFLLFSAEAVVCCFKRYIVSGVITALTGILYEATFIYFAIVVNSYLHSLNQERYL